MSRVGPSIHVTASKRGRQIHKRRNKSKLSMIVESLLHKSDKSSAANAMMTSIILLYITVRQPTPAGKSTLVI